MKLNGAILALYKYSRRGSSSVAAWVYLVVTICYLVAVLTVPLQEPQKLIWLAIILVIEAEITGGGFWSVFRRSIYILPLVIFIGIFNPIYDTEVAFRVGDAVVSKGWVSFVSIILRGLLSMQSLLLLVDAIGFYDLCTTLRCWHLPSVLVTQLLFTYRYMGVLLEEAQTMHRARLSRGFGRKSYPLSDWGRFVGQLLLRSIDRAKRIHAAMLSRGFDGTLPLGQPVTSRRNSWIFLCLSLAGIVVFRFIDFSKFFV